VSTTIALSHIWKRFGSKVALADVSFEVQPGEFFVLIGPSGAGKTTTLRVLAGLESPSSGEVRFGERVMNDVPPQARNARMAFENYSLYPHLSVRENLASPLRAQKADKREVAERIDRIATMLGLETLLDRAPRELSGGQRQRVSLGRALIVESNLLLLDEPLAHLDARIRHELRAKFHDIKSFLSRGAVIYVTHDYLEALSLADRIGVLVAGSLQQIGTPEDVYYRPSNITVARLVGQPAVNLLRARIVTESGALCADVGPVKLPVSGEIAQALEAAKAQTVILGIRPQFWNLSHSRPADAERWVEAKIGLYEIRNYKGVIRADRDNSSWLALTDTYRDPVEGSPIWLQPQWDRTLLFDEGGIRISASTGALGRTALGHS